MTKRIIKGAAIVALFAFAWLQQRTITSLRQERTRYQQNTESLLSTIGRYKTQDSLNVAEVGSLRLTISEFKKARREDADLIKSLRVKVNDLSSLAKTQAETITKMSTQAKDTIIITDTRRDSAKVIRYRSEWIDLDGILESDDKFSCVITSRDSLVIASTVRYKRFLGFLWKTKKIKSRKVSVVSKNPNTIILGSEFIEIEK